jgi:hypothetical protein
MNEQIENTIMEELVKIVENLKKREEENNIMIHNNNNQKEFIEILVNDLNNSLKFYHEMNNKLKEKEKE